MPPLEIGEFTPIPRSLAQEVGLVCAAVYGVIWRYCRKEEGVCRASLVTLGDEINVNKATMMRNIKTLCELGYLIDQTPARRNAPHTYVLGKTVAECNTSNEATEDNTEDKSVVIRNTSNETVAECNATVAHNNSSIETVAQSNLKIEESLNIESIPNIESKRATKSSRPHPIPAYQIFYEETGKFCLNKAQIKAIEETVGTDPPALEKWRDSVRAWNLEGNKPNNAGGMLDWYRTGKRSNYEPRNGVKQNGQHKSTKQPTEKPDLTNPDTWAAQLEAASGKRSSG